MNPTFESQIDLSKHSPSIVIIGTGFSGLGMAIRLKQKGIHDFVILERAGEVGGTWRDNTYPGCACDVESHLYSFSFAPNPNWSRVFSSQAEIWSYLKECSDQFHLRSHIRFDHEFKDAYWDEAEARWKIETSRGAFAAKVLISGAGALCEPMTPKISGIDRFQGKMMHSARWDHLYDLKGRTAAVIGTGASAIQFVPEIQPQVDRLLLFQRTPAWVIPQRNPRISPRKQNQFKRFPILQKAKRAKIFVIREGIGLAFRYPLVLKAFEKVATFHLRKAVRDPQLRTKLTPQYRFGCKRILLSNRYYPAVVQDNVEVVTEGIREIRENSILTQDGMEHQVDTIIFATGFHVTDSPFAHWIRGREGRSLAEIWKGSPSAHLGTTVAGFPNLFLLLGPGTGSGHTSVVLLIESQIEHIIGALQFIRENQVSAIEPKIEAQQAFRTEVEARMRHTVWVTGGCSSWYLDRNGVNSTLWPGSIAGFRKRVEPFHLTEYQVIEPTTI